MRAHLRVSSASRPLTTLSRWGRARRSPTRCARWMVVGAVLAYAGGVSHVVPLAAQSPEWDAALSAFAHRIARDVGQDDVGGIAVGVAVDGDIVWSRGFGFADRESGRIFGPGMVSRTGSISKSVTAVLMMVLVDRGVIALDDPVERYFPEVAGFKDARAEAPPITFRQLASHTAGLIREPRLDNAAAGPIEGWEDKILASIPRTHYDTLPGARYRYSNIGYGTLGLALSRAAGRPFMDMVEGEVFEPLGMTGSTFRIEEAGLQDRLATGYANGRDGTLNAAGPEREHAGRGYKVPNGGVYSTVADLARFAGALSGVPGLAILSEESRREMLTVQTPEEPGRGYGLGFSLRRNQDGSWTAGHGGSVAGYTANLAFDPDARIAVVLLRNYNRGATNLGGAARELLAELRTLGR